MDNQDVVVDQKYTDACLTIEKIVSKVLDEELNDKTEMDKAIILIASAMEKLDKAIVNGGKED